MVKYAVEHDLDIVVVKRLADLFEIIICAETAVDFSKISCVISVIVGFKDRI